MDYQAIIDHFYGTADSELKRLLMVHSRAVADKALRICDCHPEFHLDREFVEAAAMLHDIGIIQCDAPGIFCHGSQPYICHGIMGAKMISEYSRHSEPSDWLDAIARVCQRHTGAGITRAEIMEQQLPLPLPDDGSEPYMPETMEEKLVCYADKFFSKTRLDEEKSLEHVERSLAKFGEAGLTRFGRWREIFR
jgi:uncharacterized protein